LDAVVSSGEARRVARIEDEDAAAERRHQRGMGGGYGVFDGVDLATLTIDAQAFCGRG
jgi:hypothetical protein